MRHNHVHSFISSLLARLRHYCATVKGAHGANGGVLKAVRQTQKNGSERNFSKKTCIFGPFFSVLCLKGKNQRFLLTGSAGRSARAKEKPSALGDLCLECG